MCIRDSNKISPVGLNKFDPECYAVGDDEQNEDGILVRSAKLHDYAFPENLLAIAREMCIRDRYRRPTPAAPR